MKIAINDKRKIITIQEEFNSVFPYLKLEFFSTPHSSGGLTHKKFIKQNNSTLGECRTIHKDGGITIIPNMTVLDLEQIFQKVYGLSVQVFRQSGKVSLETTVTDSWTLEKQNSQGKELSLFGNSN